MRPSAKFLLLAFGWSVVACASTGTAPTSAGTAPTSSPARVESFLDTLEHRTFDFFWERSDPASGLTPDRWPTPSFSSVAAVGFALTAYPIGVERGWITRAAAAERTLTTLRYFWRQPQGPAPTGVIGHKGFFYHFLDMAAGLRFQTVELSTIDTTLLLAGVLFCREFFDGAGDGEVAIRAYADSLYRRVEWTWAQPNPPLVNMGWKPESGYLSHDWRGFNEAMILYVLALGSPTHPVNPAAWAAWSSTYQWGTFHGQAHVGFAPLFGHQYSHVWIDFRIIQDAYMRQRGIDYFENSRRATLAQQAYAIANPGGWKGYGADLWGLTAADGPADVTLPTVNGQERRFYTYAARGASFNDVRDDGTLAPTAAGGSVPFAPEIAIPALMTMRDRYGRWLWGQYGFLDSFNPTFRFNLPVQHGTVVPDVGWFDGDYLGIDQGPILAMLANHRRDFVWKYMRKSPYIIAGLRRAGFSGGWLDQAP